MSNQGQVLIQRGDILDIYRRAVSVNAAHFLDALEERMPFLLKLFRWIVALDVIRKVGIGGNFLTKKHTLKHMRDIWQPEIFDRSTYSTSGRRRRKRAASTRLLKWPDGYWLIINRFLWNLVWHRHCVELLKPHNEI